MAAGDWAGADAVQADPELSASRALPAGELAVLPDTGHLITPAAVQTIIHFLEHLTSQ